MDARFRRGGAPRSRRSSRVCPGTVYANPMLDFERPRSVEVEQLVDFATRVSWVGEETAYGSEVFERLYAPARITRTCGSWCTRGRGCSAGRALCTRGAPAFEARDWRRLGWLAEPLKAALSAAERLETAHLPRGPGYLLVSPSGAVVHASAVAECLVSSGAFSTPARGPGAGVRLGLTRAAASAWVSSSVESCGSTTGSVAYLVSASPSARPSLGPGASLTEAQRRVAELAAAGATVVVISAQVGSKPETVRTHLREVYRRLHVATRLELAAALAPRGGSAPGRERPALVA